MPLFGPPNIEQLKARRDESGLIKALSYEKDANVRRAAVEALAILRSKKSLDAICSALNDRDLDVYTTAVSALGTMGDPRATIPLISVLQNHSHLRSAVGKAFEKIGNPAIEPLIAVLNNTCNRRSQQNEFWWNYAAENNVPLAQGILDDLNKIEEEVVTILNMLESFHDPNSAKSLAFLLKDQSKRVMQVAASAMHKMGWQPDMNDEVAISYYMTIGQWSSIVEIGTPAIEPVIAALNDCNDEIKFFEEKQNAAQYHQGHQAFSDELSTLRKFKWSAIQNLGKIGNSTVVQPLLTEFRTGLRMHNAALLNLREGGPGLLAAVALAELALRGQVTESKQVVEALIIALDNSWVYSTGGYEYVLDNGRVTGRDRDDPRKHIMQRWLTGSERTKVIKALGCLGDPRAIEIIVRELKASFGKMMLADGTENSLREYWQTHNSSARQKADADEKTMIAEILKNLGWQG